MATILPRVAATLSLQIKRKQSVHHMQVNNTSPRNNYAQQL